MASNAGYNLFDAEPLIRLAVFAGALAMLATAEVVAPRRRLTIARHRRWAGNIGVVAIDTMMVRILFPTAAVGTALLAEARGTGLLNNVEIPTWLSLLIAFVLLDLIIYSQHRLFHAAPWLWRLHRMHHSDRDLDVTSGVRFHPLEILLSMGIKLGAVILIGAPAAAVMLFEVVLNATAMFSHSNIRLPLAVDRWLRLLIVTPDMHRVHHSVEQRELQSNFGFNLPWWDRLFGTYRAQPAAGHEAMTIGVAGSDERDALRLDRMLLEPLRRTPNGETTA